MIVNPLRQTNGIQGLGLHKCIGITFVEEVSDVISVDLQSTTDPFILQTMPEVCILTSY